ncbi:hypothetical protein K491DRAFT_691386 [Lophiostoma macrostomum CBS 122681]|uniref:Phytanoyl-CoA dioxygenase-like protein n=1 Tax=Lophiostoma macrostomum CBS 122681 TaxID=1314788 RepID=A0A6A6TBJ5_9PLEO|nr:hypothetical protein K491DRAFT_691386 [Lophiostoma macrostomum CBS 122681]
MNGVADTNGHTPSKTNGRHPSKTAIPPRLFSTSNPPSLQEFKDLTTKSTCPAYPLATTITSNIPIYTLPPYSSLTPSQLSALQDEWNHILLSGPGVFVTKNLFPSAPLLSRVNAAFSQIIASERSSSAPKGDHFATSGANDRIWNSFSKHGLTDPCSFVTYYSNPYLPLIASAWLGPHHRLTAQVNIVKPGSAPQISHRDYHLGFQSALSCSAFPRAAQVASQFLTLQGAVAHSDMPVESGPTRLLPFSQMFEEGYMAYRLAGFQEFFAEQYVSMPLSLGDGLFFNPALFHAAGENESRDVMRSANLLQISSAFGKTMESVDTLSLLEACWEELVLLYRGEGMSVRVQALIGHLAEGYPFPTNLDRRVPGPGGMAPESERDVLRRGLERGASREEVLGEIRRVREDARA